MGRALEVVRTWKGGSSAADACMDLKEVPYVCPLNGAKATERCAKSLCFNCADIHP